MKGLLIIGLIILVAFLVCKDVHVNHVSKDSDATYEDTMVAIHESNTEEYSNGTTRTKQSSFVITITRDTSDKNK